MLMSNNEYEYCSNELYDGFLQSLANSNCNGNQLTSLSPSDPASPTTHDQAFVEATTANSANANSATANNFGGNIGHSGVNNHSTQAIMASMQAVSLQSSPGKSYTDYIDELASDLDSRYWESKPPHQWTSEDVWHWIFSWAGDRSVDVEEIHPLAYSNMTGEQLCSMSRTDFVNLNPRYGGDIFDTLQQLSNRFNLFRSCSPSSSSNMADVSIGIPNQASLTALMASVHSPNANSASPPSSSPCSLSSSSPSSLCSSSSPSTSESSPNAMNGSYVSSNVLPSFDLLRSSCSLDLECHGGHHSPSSNVSESDRDSTSSTLTTVNDRNHYLLGQNATVHLSNLHSSHHHHHHHQNLCPDDLPNLTGSNAQGTTQHHLLPNGSSSSPSSTHSSSSSASSSPGSSGGSIAPPPYQLVSDHSLTSALLMPMKKVGRRGRPPKRESKSRSRQGKGNGKLWEFIRDLLLDPMTNPSFIRWERREDGVFKFVQSDKVAKLWGQRKQNPRMTYEKLSRAMRYYYKSQVLLPVFGRRLVYKFGPNATGWRPHQVSL